MPPHTHPEYEVIAQNTADNIERIYERLGRIEEATLGNGDPAKGLASRVAVLEQADRSAGRATDRGWKVLAVCISSLAVLITLINALT